MPKHRDRETVRPAIRFTMQPERYKKLCALADRKHIPIQSYVAEVIDCHLVEQYTNRRFEMPEHHYTQSQGWVDPL